MKRTLIYAGAAFTLATAALIYVGYASAKTDNGKVSAVDNNNVQFPSNRWRLVKHTVQLHIPHNNKALSQLIIDVPSTVAVSNDIDVLNERGQKLNINVSVSGKKIIINFPETVTSSTTRIQLNLNKVEQPILGPASVYHFSAKVVGSNAEIPVGIAQFTTF